MNALSVRLTGAVLFFVANVGSDDDDDWDLSAMSDAEMMAVLCFLDVLCRNVSARNRFWAQHVLAKREDHAVIMRYAAQNKWTWLARATKSGLRPRDFAPWRVNTTVLCCFWHDTLAGRDSDLGGDRRLPFLSPLQPCTVPAPLGLVRMAVRMYMEVHRRMSAREREARPGHAMFCEAVVKCMKTGAHAQATEAIRALVGEWPARCPGLNLDVDVNFLFNGAVYYCMSAYARDVARALGVPVRAVANAERAYERDPAGFAARVETPAALLHQSDFFRDREWMYYEEGGAMQSRPK